MKLNVQIDCVPRDELVCLLNCICKSNIIHHSNIDNENGMNFVDAVKSNKQFFMNMKRMALMYIDIIVSSTNKMNRIIKMKNDMEKISDDDLNNAEYIVFINTLKSRINQYNDDIKQTKTSLLALIYKLFYNDTEPSDINVHLNNLEIFIDNEEYMDALYEFCGMTMNGLYKGDENAK